MSACILPLTIRIPFDYTSIINHSNHHLPKPNALGTNHAPDTIPSSEHHPTPATTPPT